jgi:hypothetical protein
VFLGCVCVAFCPKKEVKNERKKMEENKISFEHQIIF